MTKAFLFSFSTATAVSLVLAANPALAGQLERIGDTAFGANAVNTHVVAAATDGDDDTIETATPINLNEDVEAALDEAGDVDYWQFEMPGRGTVTAQTTGTTDTFGQLLTGSGFNLGEDDDSG